VEGDGPVAAGEKLDVGALEAGWVTSSAVSPANGSIALAYLHRDHAKPGASLTTASGRAALVTALPMQP
jgi:glycine cleavage system aminomethyltransferase T